MIAYHGRARRQRTLALGVVAMLGGAVAPGAANADRWSLTIDAQHVLAPVPLHHAMAIDLDRDGRPEVVGRAGSRNGYVIVIDPLTGEAITAQAFAADLHSIEQVPSPAGWPAAFVSLDLAGEVVEWGGLPLRRQRSIDTGLQPNATSTYPMRVGDVDGDGLSELVMCAGNLLVFDLESGEQTSFDASCSVGIELVQVDETPQLEILTNTRGIYGEVASVYTHDGQLLVAAPRAIRGRIAVGQLDGDPYSELLVESPTDSAWEIDVHRIDLSLDGWIESSFHGFEQLRAEDLRLVDRDMDGRHEWATMDAHGLLVVDTGSGEALFSSGSRYIYPECWLVLGSIDVDSRTEAYCSGSNDHQLIEFERRDPQWASTIEYIPASAGAVAGQGILLALHGAHTGIVTRVQPLDGSALAPGTAFDTQEPGGFMTAGMSVVPGDAGDAVALAQGRWVSLYDLDSGTQWWSVERDFHSHQAVEPLRTGNGGYDVAALAGEPPCRVTRFSAASGDILWNSPFPLAHYGPFRDMQLVAVQLNGTGAEDLVASCGGNTIALDGDDGSEIWFLGDHFRDIDVVDTDTGVELLLSSPDGMERRSLAGVLLERLAGRADAVVVGDDYRDVLIRLDGGVRRIDAVSGEALTDTLAIGRSLSDELLELPAGSDAGRLRFAALTDFGAVVAYAPRVSPLFASGFEP